MCDIFDSALGLEEDHIKDGYAEGLTAGRAVGHTEGKALGIRQGFAVGHEIGVYSGCAQIWRQIETKRAGFMNTRADKALMGLERLIERFPLDNPLDERLQDLLEDIRARYKAVIAMLGLPDAWSLLTVENESTKFTQTSPNQHQIDF